MRLLAAFLAAFLLGALSLGAGEEGDAELLGEIERLTALLRERAATLQPAPQEEMVLQLYDVTDLCSPVEDEQFAPIRLAKAGKGDLGTEECEPSAPYDADGLVELIRTAVAPASWEAWEGASIEVLGGMVLIRTSPRVHAALARFLAKLRTLLARQPSVEIVAVAVGPEEFALLDERPRELSPEDAARLLAKPPLGAARLRGFDGQQTARREGRERSYVGDYDVKIAVESAIGDPLRMQIFEGVAFEVRPVLDRGAGGALLHVRLERALLDEPMRARATEYGPLELPALEFTRLRTSLWVPVGTTVVLGGCTSGERSCLFLATVTDPG